MRCHLGSWLDLREVHGLTLTNNLLSLSPSSSAFSFLRSPLLPSQNCSKLQRIISIMAARFIILMELPQSLCHQHIMSIAHSIWLIPSLILLIVLVPKSKSRPDLQSYFWQIFYASKIQWENGLHSQDSALGFYQSTNQFKVLQNFYYLSSNDKAYYCFIYIYPCRDTYSWL